MIMGACIKLSNGKGACRICGKTIDKGDKQIKITDWNNYQVIHVSCMKTFLLHSKES